MAADADVFEKLRRCMMVLPNGYLSSAWNTCSGNIDASGMPPLWGCF
jgi:hypothetical protein